MKLTAEAKKAAKPFRTRLKALHDEFEQVIAPARERMRELQDELEELEQDFDPDLPERPEPELDLEDEDPLFDSQRHWLLQLERYKRDRELTRDEEEDDDD